MRVSLGNVCLTSQGVFSLDDCIQRGRLDGLGQEVADRAKSQKFDAEGDFMKWCPEDFWSHVGLQPACANTCTN